MLPRCERAAVDPLPSRRLCAECLDEIEDDAEGEGHPEPEDRPHDNPIDAAGVTDDERAAMLREYLEAYVAEFDQVPRLMPLDEEGKAPIIQGRCPLDSPEGRSYLVDGEEAIRQIREGARGFAIYAGKRDHGTEDVVLVDDDDPDSFPREAFPSTLQVLTGSGRGTHDTYRNAGDVQNAKGKDGVDGEVRAENWYCVTPGSIHPSGGVYHVVEDRPVATLATDDVPEVLQPGSRRRREEGQLPDAPDEDADPPDGEEIQERLERAFENPHDGDRMRDVYNGRYAAAGFDDRSGAEFWFANRVDSWVGRGNVVEQVLDSGHLDKWGERTDASYRDSILANVGYQDWYFDLEADDGAPEPVSALPLEQLSVLDPEEARRFARKRGIEWPSTDAARRRLQERIAGAMHTGEDVVLDAPTALGKTHTVATEPWLVRPDVTGDQPVIHLHETREARDQALAASRAADGVDARVIRGRDEVCPVAAGNHDPVGEDEDRDPPDQVVTVDGQAASAAFDELCDGRGLPFSVVHAYVTQHNDQMLPQLPCCADGECHGLTQWDDVPRGDDGPVADVIHATHQFAHVPSLRMHTNLVFDERPDFTADGGEDGQGLTHDRIRRAVTAFLRETDEGPDTYEALVSYAHEDVAETDLAHPFNEQVPEAQRLDRGRYLAAVTAVTHEPDREWYLSTPTPTRSHSPSHGRSSMPSPRRAAPTGTGSPRRPSATNRRASMPTPPTPTAGIASTSPSSSTKSTPSGPSAPSPIWSTSRGA